jgi:hypothetical protein
VGGGGGVGGESEGGDDDDEPSEPLDDAGGLLSESAGAPLPPPVRDASSALSVCILPSSGVSGSTWSSGVCPGPGLLFIQRGYNAGDVTRAILLAELDWKVRGCSSSPTPTPWREGPGRASCQQARVALVFACAVHGRFSEKVAAGRKLPSKLMTGLAV